MKQILQIVICCLSMALITGMQDSMYIMEDVQSDNNYGNPIYSYFYSVNNPKTGDIKSHQETRSGSMVKGFYKVANPEGTMREIRAFLLPGSKKGYQDSMYPMPDFLNTPYQHHIPTNPYYP